MQSDSGIYIHISLLFQILFPCRLLQSAEQSFLCYTVKKSESEVTQSCPCDPWTIQSMEFSRQKYWSGQLFSFPGDRPSPGIEPRSPTLQTDSLPSVLVNQLFYIQQCVCVKPKLLIYPQPPPPTPPCFLFGNHTFVFKVCESVSVL